MMVELDIQELEEFVVTSSTTDMETSTTFSIPVAKLSKIPTVLGEPDLFKSLALLPGVSTGIEGSSGLFVRSGTPDQNLILLDDVPIYTEMKIYYTRRIEEGKSKMSTLNIIRNKLLARTFAVVNRNSSYVDTLKYAV